MGAKNEAKSQNGKRDCTRPLQDKEPARRGGQKDAKADRKEAIPQQTADADAPCGRPRTLACRGTQHQSRIAPWGNGENCRGQGKGCQSLKARHHGPPFQPYQDRRMGDERQSAPIAVRLAASRFRHGVSQDVCPHFVAVRCPRRELAPVTRVGPLAWLWSGAPCLGGSAPFWRVQF
jgi:hypothetical protein